MDRVGYTARPWLKKKPLMEKERTLDSIRQSELRALFGLVGLVCCSFVFVFLKGCVAVRKMRMKLYSFQY